MIKILAFIVALFAFTSTEVRAQTPVLVYCDTGIAGANRYVVCNSTYSLPVSASVSASITGFPTIQSTGTPISVTTGGVTGTLPTGAVVVATNVGATNGAYCKLGGSATTSDQYIGAGGGWFAFTVGANTQLTCITSTSTTTVNMVGGSGLPTGAGSGGALPAGAATSANQSTEITSLSTIATNTGAAIPAGTNTIGSVGVTPYPVGATAITASATGTTAATTATLAGTSGKTTYICGYSIRANATGAATVTDTITGVITGTLSSILWVAPLASGIGVDEQIFSPCIPASGTNQAIAIVSGAPGSGGTVSAKGWGYQL